MTTTTHKPSETIKTMHDIIAKIPADKIYLREYRSSYFQLRGEPAIRLNRRAFYSATDCGSHGCIFGWAATSAALAPVWEEYCPTRCWLLWDKYIARILNLPTLANGYTMRWYDYPMYRYIFYPEQYSEIFPGSTTIKREILRRLKLIARVLRENNEDPNAYYPVKTGTAK